jgi:hypothetical protein
MKSYITKGLAILVAVASVSAAGSALAAGPSGHYQGVRHGKRTVCHYHHGHRICKWL